MADLAFRTRNACGQLTRYGGAVFSTELAEVLDAITDINDDLHHMRDAALVRDQIERAKSLLDALAAGLGPANKLEIIPVYKRFWWPHVYARERARWQVKVLVGYRYFVDGVEYTDLTLRKIKNDKA